MYEDGKTLRRIEQIDALRGIDVLSDGYSTHAAMQTVYISKNGTCKE